MTHAIPKKNEFVAYRTLHSTSVVSLLLGETTGKEVYETHKLDQILDDKIKYEQRCSKREHSSNICTQI